MKKEFFEDIDDGTARMLARRLLNLYRAVYGPQIEKHDNETCLHKLIDMKCSIGFSAILYGLLSWEITSGCKEFDYHIVTVVIFDIITSHFNTRISLISHFMGLISGFILGTIIKYDLSNH